MRCTCIIELRAATASVACAYRQTVDDLYEYVPMSKKHMACSGYSR